MPIVRVALDVPLDRLFDYVADTADASDIGRRVRVPFGRTRKIGVIVGVNEPSEQPEGSLKHVEAVLEDAPPLPSQTLELTRFAAQYYQSPWGEALALALPPRLRQIGAAETRRSPPRFCKKPAALPPPSLNEEQAAAVASIGSTLSQFAAHLLFGVTGSGKTEVYLRLIELALREERQALLLVPEINLTPQLEERVARRFPDVPIISLHSELGLAARTRHWLSAVSGEARIILGTRLAVFTPLPQLGLILVDEEHDPSFKQQDGIRYSARDLAVVRAQQEKVPIVLGSATPSLESWANAGNGRYTQHPLTQRAVSAAALPRIRLIDTRREKLQDGLSSELIARLDAGLRAREQSLVFLNRRGFAPVLACPSCGWISRCRRCAANLVVHLADRRLRCHHCGFGTSVPRQCPTCGNQDIHPFGRGTQRLETTLNERFPEARVLRVDRDSARSRGQWEEMARQIHAGEADILVGTQMLAKGHDFPLLTLVGVVGADAALFAADWRAPERLFAQLMQVAGRAGRAELPGEVLIQTEHPEHPLYAALQDHDYPAFAEALLAERRSAGFPPYAYHAILRAEAPQMGDALAFLNTAREAATEAAATDIMLYDAVPMRLTRLANFERAQLLVESNSRPALQRFLSAWRLNVERIKTPKRLRWHLEVDPIEC